MSDTDRLGKDRTVNVPKAVLFSTIAAVVSGTFTYAVAQAKMCGDVREDNIQLKAQVASQKDDMKDVRDRLSQVASQMDKLLGQNTELITLIRVQNQLKQP